MQTFIYLSALPPKSNISLCGKWKSLMVTAITLKANSAPTNLETGFRNKLVGSARNDSEHASFEAQPEHRLLLSRFVVVMLNPSKQIPNRVKHVKFATRVNRPPVTFDPTFTERRNSCHIIHTHYSIIGNLHILNLGYTFTFSAILYAYQPPYAGQTTVLCSLCVNCT
jgi:hypothetical protein